MIGFHANEIVQLSNCTIVPVRYQVIRGTSSAGAASGGPHRRHSQTRALFTHQLLADLHREIEVTTTEYFKPHFLFSTSLLGCHALCFRPTTASAPVPPDISTPLEEEARGASPTRRGKRQQGRQG